jgi:hypothetical protein
MSVLPAFGSESANLLGFPSNIDWGSESSTALPSGVLKLIIPLSLPATLANNLASGS